MKPKGKIIQEYCEESFNKRNFEKGSFDIFSDEIILDGVYGKRIGAQAAKSLLSGWLHAVPDSHIDISQIDTYENTVVVSMTLSGTHFNPFKDTLAKNSDLKTNFTSELEQFKPQHKKFSLPGEYIFILSKNKIRQHIFTNYDVLHFREQIGMEIPLIENRSRLDEPVLRSRLELLGKPRLTHRETDCLALNLSGFSAKQVGMVLGNSHRTVECHLQHAFHKVGCYNRLDCLEKMTANEVLPICHSMSLILVNNKKLETHGY